MQTALHLRPLQKVFGNQLIILNAHLPPARVQFTLFIHNQKNVKGHKHTETDIS